MKSNWSTPLLEAWYRVTTTTGAALSTGIESAIEILGMTHEEMLLHMARPTP